MVFIIRNFLSTDDMRALNAFVDEGVKLGWLGPGIDRGRFNYSGRYTSRLYGDNFEYPQIVGDVYKRITDALSLHDLKKSVRGGGRDGVVVSCTFSGGDVYEHKDPKEENDLEVLRCNIMTRSPTEGGVLFVDGKQVDLSEGDLHCYLASNVKHYVTPVSGPISRVLWMFGYQVSQQGWSKKLADASVRLKQANEGQAQ